MNKKQLVVMWIGIAILVAFCLFAMNEAGRGDNIMVFQSIAAIIVSITIGLVVQTGQKGKKPKDEKDNK